MTALLELDNVSVRYRGGALAVQGASLKLERGECAVVLGPNGAGKTSLVRAIAGFLRHERVNVAGSVAFGGTKLVGKATSTIARLGIAYIPERDKVFRELTIRENLHVFTERRASKAGLDEDYDYVFALFPALNRLPQDRVAGLLSGGEQQMLALAGALVARPSVMLVDEPSLGLAPKLVTEVMRSLHRIRTERNLALVLVDQNVRATARLATDMYTMHSGVLTHETGDDVIERLAREGLRGSGEVTATSRVEAPAQALACEGVTLSFGGVHALSDVSFALAQGAVVGLIGPNGAGKTSLLNCLTGFYRPSSGSILVGDVTVNGLSTVAIAALGVSRTFQQAESLSGMGTLDVFLLGRERFLPRGILRYSFGSPKVRRAERDAKQLILTIADELGIRDFVERNTPYENLPYGVRKLVDLGRALACEPTVLLMDEPAAGLSAEEKGRMIDAILRIKAERGITQLLVDHDIQFVSAVSSRLVVLDAGVLIADGGVDEVLGDTRVIDSYIGPADTEDWPEEARP